MQQLGKYRLLEPVASGGMADVFRAEAPGPGGFVKQVALKLIREEHGDSSDFVRMFIEEACLASRLSHANIVQVFEFDRIDGRYIIAMEFVHGRNLRQVADRCRELGVKLGLARAVHIGLQVARALAYAHRADGGPGGGGIVHRDVSPQNVLVSFEGEVKLTDFGIARARGRSQLTAPGTIKGKLAYMAPEQARGEAVDARADVFGLAVVLWELCSGRPLFARDSDAATLAALLGEQIISPPSSWNEAVPPELDRAIMAGLERAPERRTSGAEQLADQLGAVLARCPEETDLRGLMRRLWPQPAGALAPPRPVEPTVLQPEGPPGADEASTLTAVVPPGARWVRPAGFALAALLALALGAGGLSWVRDRPQRAPGPGASPASLVVMAVVPPSAPPAAPVALAARPAPAITSSPGLGTLSLPPPESGDGLLSVNAVPWGTIYLDGAKAGDTPRELRLPAGSHRLWVVHPRQGTWEKAVVVIAGKRSRIHVRFRAAAQDPGWP